MTAAGSQIRFDLQTWLVRLGLNSELKLLWWWTVFLVADCAFDEVVTGLIFLGVSTAASVGRMAGVQRLVYRRLVCMGCCARSD